MLAGFAVDVAHGLADDFLQQLAFHVQLHGAALHAGDAQQIFHQIDQPHGVVVDVLADLLFARLRQVAGVV